MVRPGDPAPAFRLPSTSGREVALSQLRGRKLVLYFYPRDDTPGCTREACGFRDNLARVRGAGAEVLGVSKDPLAAHERFRAKYDLPFDLLSDAGNQVARAYGAFGTKTLYGKKVEGTIRSTFLIDERGRVERVWSPVQVDGHVDQVVAALAGETALAKPPKRPSTKNATTKKKTAKSSTAKAARKKSAKRVARKA